MITQNEIESQILASLKSKREIPASLKKRGVLVFFYCYKLKKKSEILKSEQIPATTLNRWLKKWEINGENRLMWFEWYESKEITEQEYSSLLLSILKDAPRTGSPAKFEEKTIEKIVALAASDPQTLGLPYSKWSEELLKRELIKRKIVKTISTSQIGRFLKRSSNQTSP
jgi:putative transposase